MLYLAGIAIDFFLVAILATKKEKSEADKILALWLFFIGLHLTAFYLFITRQYIQYPQILGIEIPFPLLHGPFLYLYTSYLTNQLPKRNTKYLHFLPFALAYIPLLSFLFSSNDNKITTYNHQGAGYEWIMAPMSVAIIISGISYVLLSLQKLNRHRKNINDQFSNTDKINLAWLRYLIFGVGIIWIVVILGKDEPTFATVVLFVFFMGYFGIKQTSIFSHIPPTALIDDPAAETKTASEIESSPVIEPEKEPNQEKEKYLKSGLSESEMQFISNRLNDLMQRERLYTNPELTLGEMALQLNIHPNYLSQVINSVEKKNFYDYINTYRVEEFNRMVKLPKNQKFTLLALAFECGFNSKTSFNRNFRKVTGLSPTEYLKQMNVTLNQAS
jgi:AraC-like DNA-binding protein